MGQLIPFAPHLARKRAAGLDRQAELAVLHSKRLYHQSGCLLAETRLEQSRHRRFLLRWEQQIARYEAEERKLRGGAK